MATHPFLDALRQRFPNDILADSLYRGDVSATVRPDSIAEIARFVRDDPGLRAAFFAKGASLYAGWSAPTCTADPERLLIDRLCGTNQHQPESPKQRPFDWKSVYGWMQGQGLDIGYGCEDGGIAFLRVTANPSNAYSFGLLAPSMCLLLT